MAYQLTSLGISVLALLRDRPMHGYEMFQTLVARHENLVLKVRPGSLYHVVYRLAEEKLIRQTGTARNGNRPERTTYELTDAGADALTERVRELVASPVNEFEKFVVALSEIHNLDVPTAVEALRLRISALEAGAAEIRAQLAAGTAQRFALDYLLATTTAKLTWLRRFVESLQSERLEWQRAAQAATIEGSSHEVGT
jgi:DNA-binding PadR family transcriptional regulator